MGGQDERFRQDGKSTDDSQSGSRACHLMDDLDLMDKAISQCTATSKQSGRRCKRRPIPGGKVCKIHGGGAIQVQTAARERLQALVDPAIGALQKALDKGDYGNIIKAAQVVLDRTGYGPKSTTELTGKDGGPIETKHTIDVGLLCNACLKKVRMKLEE